jgi:hypothetical protein
LPLLKLLFYGSQRCLKSQRVICCLCLQRLSGNAQGSFLLKGRSKIIQVRLANIIDIRPQHFLKPLLILKNRVPVLHALAVLHAPPPAYRSIPTPSTAVARFNVALIVAIAVRITLFFTAHEAIG